MDESKLQLEIAGALRERLCAAWASVENPLADVLFPAPAERDRLWQSLEVGIEAWIADRARRITFGGRGRPPRRPDSADLAAATDYLCHALCDAVLVEVICHGGARADRARAMLWDRLTPLVRRIAQRLERRIEAAGRSTDDLLTEVWLHLIADKPDEIGRTGRTRSGKAKIVQYDIGRKATVATFVDQIALRRMLDLTKPSKGRLSIDDAFYRSDESGRTWLDGAISEEQNRREKAAREAREQLEALEHCCRLLVDGGFSPRKMIAFRSYWFSERKYREISDDLDCAVGWACEAVQDAQRRLAALLRTHYPDLAAAFEPRT